MQEHRRVVVVGAGLSGLACAYELRHLDPFVLEAGESAGGRVGTVERNGHLFNLGAEYWLTAPSDEASRALLDELGVKVRTDQWSGSGFARRGRWVPTNEPNAVAEHLGFNAGATASYLATYERIADTADQLWSASCPDALVEELMNHSALDWLGSTHPDVIEFYDELACVTPGQHLADLHALFLCILLPAVAGTSRHQWGAQTIQGGSRAIADGLAARLPTPVRTGSPVLAVVDGDRSCEVTYLKDGQPVRCTADCVILTAPAPAAAAIVPALPRWKREALSHTFYAPWMGVDILVRADEIPQWHDVLSFPILEGPVSLVLNSAVANHGEPVTPGGDGWKLRLLNGGTRADAHLDLDPGTYGTMAVAALRELTPVPLEIEHVATRSWVSGAPHLRWGTDYGSPENVRALAAPVGRIHFAGDYMGFVDADRAGGFGPAGARDYRTTTYMSTALRSGRRAAAAARAALGAPEA